MKKNINKEPAMLAAVSLGIAVGTTVALACSKQAASSAVGPCATDVTTCSSFSTAAACTTASEVNDFPTSCEATESLTNCNTPQSNCKRTVDCT